MLHFLRDAHRVERTPHEHQRNRQHDYTDNRRKVRGVIRAVAKSEMQEQLSKNGGMFGAIVGIVAAAAGVNSLRNNTAHFKGPNHIV